MPRSLDPPPVGVRLDALATQVRVVLAVAEKTCLRAESARERARVDRLRADIDDFNFDGALAKLNEIALAGPGGLRG